MNFNKKKQSNKAFTIIEILVVITILSILLSVSFVSYTSHLVTARDTNRVVQLSSIAQLLQAHSTKNILPMPQESVKILIGTGLVSYQGYIGKEVLSAIGYTKGGQDPTSEILFSNHILRDKNKAKEKMYFTYYLTANQKYFQLMGHLEDISNKQVLGIFQQTNAFDYTHRFPTLVGNKLGILTESDTNKPIQEVLSVSSNGYINITYNTDIYTANFTDNSSFTGTGGKLVHTAVSFSIGKKHGSCKEIYDKNTVARLLDGNYYINTLGGEHEVYCDMVVGKGIDTVIID